MNTHALSAMLTILVSCVSGFSIAGPYGINPGDAIAVFIWNEEELSQELLVGPDGALSFPMVGRIEAQGLSVDEVAKRISQGLANFLRDEPLVTVSLVGTEGNKVFVHGEVLKSGAYVVSRDVDIVQALALASGLTEYANRSEIKVVRRLPTGERKVFEFNYDRFKNGRDLDSNIVLQAGDLVVVP